MILLLVWMAGVATAAAASEQDSKRQRALSSALRQQLGLEPEKRLSAPVAPGVPMWVWEDGDKIIRIVTLDEAKSSKALDGTSIWRLKEMSGVTPIWRLKEMSGVTRYEYLSTQIEDSDYRLFAYLDRFNRVKVYLSVECHVIKRLFSPGFDKESISENSEFFIEEPKIRSRIFRFLQDYDLADSFDDHNARLLWHRNTLVKMVARDIISRREGLQLDEEIQTWLSSIRGIGASAYAFAYSHLVYTFEKFSHLARRYQELSLLHGEDQKSLVEECSDQMNEAALELKMAAKEEGEKANELLEFHSLYRCNAWMNLVDSLSVEFELNTNGLSAESAETRRLKFDFGGKDRLTPQWSVGDNHRFLSPGFLPALLESGVGETALDLYEAFPEEPVWVYPGPNPPPGIEAKILLGWEFDPTDDLDDMLLDLEDLNLLSTEQKTYWKDLLAARKP